MTLPDAPNIDPDQDFSRPYLLIDRFKSLAIARIISTPSTIEMLNRTQWMHSKGWKYVQEDKSDILFYLGVDHNLPFERHSV